MIRIHYSSAAGHLKGLDGEGKDGEVQKRKLDQLIACI